MKRDYGNGYPSVTQVLDVLRKKGLEFYFQYNTPEFLKAESKKNLSIGTTTHEVIQAHIEKDKIDIETEYPGEVMTAVKSFFLFKKENPKIKLKRAEVQITSEKYKYNGLLDCLGNESGSLILVDWKTGKCNVDTKKETDIPKIYPEYCYQATAYVMAYNEQEKANIQRAMIVSIAKDKVAYNKLILLKNSMDGMFNEVFLPALKICNYQRREL
jgi:ATP-dependent exoDNAse (exonuclease V) beta subunit